MIIDKLCEFASDVSGAGAAASRQVGTALDTVKQGAVLKQEPFLVIQVDTGFDASSTALVLTFSLETYTSDSFGSARTVLWSTVIPASAKATAVAGYQVCKVPVSLIGAQEFLNVICTPSGETATAGKFSAFLVFEPDVMHRKS